MSYVAMKQALESEGWVVEYNYWCCQSCGWTAIQDRCSRNEAIDPNKVLFCHEQDVCVEKDIECPNCYGDAEIEVDCHSCESVYGDVDEDCHECGGTGFYTNLCDECDGTGRIYEDEPVDPAEIEGTHFAMGDAEEFQKVLPLIENSGCTVEWNGTQEQRPYINFNN